MLPEDVRALALLLPEVRAFGILLEELLSRCGPASTDESALWALARACTQPDAQARPTMADITAALSDRAGSSLPM